MRALVLVALLSFAPPVAAQQVAPETSPLPPDRPDPEDRLQVLEADKPTDVPRAPPVRQTLTETSNELAACMGVLNDFGAVYEQVPALSEADDTDCGIANPIRVTEILPGVALNPAATLRCETATALAGWMQQVVQPAARQMADRGAVVGLDQGSGYTCRRRNNAAEGKLSEHSFGNAIAIMAFRFSEGDPIRVEPREREGTMAEAFQRAVRAGSCLYFTTVLGPGSDAAHADHLHMDIKERNGGYRLCQ